MNPEDISGQVFLLELQQAVIQAVLDAPAEKPELKAA